VRDLLTVVVGLRGVSCERYRTYLAGAGVSSKCWISETCFAACMSCKVIPLQWRQVGKRRPLMTVAVGHVGVQGIVGDRINPGLRHDLARFALLRHAFSETEIIDDF
jgi:hypothetical protein